MADNDAIVSMNVDKALVERIVREKIQAAVVAALSQEHTMIEKAVALCLSAKVDSSGNYTNRDYENHGTLLEVLAKNAIKEATKAALVEWCAENKEIIKKHIKARFQKDNKDLAESFFDGMMKSMSSSYYLNVNFKSPERT